MIAFGTVFERVSRTTRSNAFICARLRWPLMRRMSTRKR